MWWIAGFSALWLAIAIPAAIMLGRSIIMADQKEGHRDV